MPLEVTLLCPVLSGGCGSDATTDAAGPCPHWLCIGSPNLRGAAGKVGQVNPEGAAMVYDRVPLCSACSNYLPATGRLIRHRPPAQSPSVRVDSGITQGDSISTFYDPMIAKMITYGEWCGCGARVLGFSCGAQDLLGTLPAS